MEPYFPRFLKKIWENLPWLEEERCCRQSWRTTTRIKNGKTTLSFRFCWQKAESRSLKAYRRALQENPFSCWGGARNLALMRPRPLDLICATALPLINWTLGASVPAIFLTANAGASAGQKSWGKIGKNEQTTATTTAENWANVGEIFFGNAKFSAALAGFYSLVIGLELDPSSTRGLIDKSGTLV